MPPRSARPRSKRTMSMSEEDEGKILQDLWESLYNLASMYENIDELLRNTDTTLRHVADLNRQRENFEHFDVYDREHGINAIDDFISKAFFYMDLLDDQKDVNLRRDQLNMFDNHMEAEFLAGEIRDQAENKNVRRDEGRRFEDFVGPTSAYPPRWKYFTPRWKVFKKPSLAKKEDTPPSFDFSRTGGVHPSMFIKTEKDARRHMNVLEARLRALPPDSAKAERIRNELAALSGLHHIVTAY